MKNVWPSYDISPIVKNNRTYIRSCDKPLARLDTEEYHKAIQDGLRFSPNSNYSIALCNLAYDNNIGNCIRTADAFGAKEVFLLGSKQFNKKASVGSEFLNNIYHIPTLEGWEEAIGKFQYIIAVDNNNNFPEDLTFQLNDLPKLKGKILYLFGNEGFGIPETFLNYCDYQIYLPMAGTTRSVNVASACAVVLYNAMMRSDDTKHL